MRESVQRPKSRKRVAVPWRSMSLERGAAGIGRGDQRADAGAGDEIDRDFVFFQDAENADVRDAARKSAAQGDAYLRTFARGRTRRSADHEWLLPAILFWFACPPSKDPFVTL